MDYDDNVEQKEICFVCPFLKRVLLEMHLLREI